jgi:anion-transporting  ArsA/GET3 family ATPase
MSDGRIAEPVGDLADDVAGAHILVTTGAGGVGKTTTAAALGLAGALRGRRTLVLTIDPARRLAQAMGLDDLDDEPRQVEVADAPEGGELWAMMLDMQTTFDRLIERHATSKQRAEAIRANRIYRTLSSNLSGTQEYMAMERLHELHDSGEWDLLVIDTPPTRSALDFLDAPKRMSSFLEGRLLQLLLRPGMAAGKGIGRMVGAGASAFMRVAGKVTGMDLLEDLAEFFRNFEGMYAGFKQRADQVIALLQEPTSRFVVVASPEPPPLREARFFLERLEQEGLHAAGVVINRVRPEIPRDPSTAAVERVVEAQGDDLPGQAVAGAVRLLDDVRNLGARQRRDVAAALYGVSAPIRVDLPLLGGDVHDLEGLATIAATLTTGKTR